MPLSAGQIAVSSSTRRFRVVIAGRRWGKTHLAIRELAQSATRPDQRCFYVAPTYRQAKQIVWDPLKSKLSKLNWVHRINESDLTITLINGSKISLRGADNPDSLRGVGLDFVCLDEFAMIDSRAWTEVLRPTLSDRMGRAMFISTPMGTANWSYDLYQQGQDPQHTEWSSWQYTTVSGGRITAEEIAQAERDLDPRTFRQEYLASFETYSGRIYYAFDRRLHVRNTQPNEAKELLLCCDFNVNPISAVVAEKTQQGLHCRDEIVIYGSNTDELVQEVKNRYPLSKITAFPDPSGVQRKTSAGGRTDISILENAGFQVRYHRNHPPVRDRINAVNALLSQNNLTIDSQCRRLIESLDKHCYKENTQIPDKDLGWDHMTDALGYAVEYLWPIRKIATNSGDIPLRWGHNLA